MARKKKSTMARKKKTSAGITGYKGYKFLTDKQQRLFRNIFGALSGGNSVFMQSADPIHKARLGRILTKLAGMNVGARERFIQRHWVVFEEIFTNSEMVRSGGGNHEMSTEDANSLIDNMYNALVYDWDNAMLQPVDITKH